MRSHKYIARVKSGNGYRYFYDADEYNAYKSGGTSHPNRPHSRKPKIAKNVFGMPETAVVKKGTRVGHYNGVYVTPTQVSVHHVKPINGKLPTDVKIGLKEHGDKRRAEREKLYAELDKIRENQRKDEEANSAYLKKQQKRTDKIVEKAPSTFNQAASFLNDLTEAGGKGNYKPLLNRLIKKKKKKPAKRKQTFASNEAAKAAFESNQANLDNVIKKARKKKVKA